MSPVFRRVTRSLPKMFVLALALGGLGSAHGATVVFDTSLLGGGNSILSSPTVGTTGATIQYTSTAVRQAGLTFSLSSAATLGEVSILVGSGWASTILGREMSIEVVQLASLTSTPADSGTVLLSSETATLPLSTAIPTTSSFYLTFNLAAPLALSAGQAYGILLAFDGVGGNTTGMSLRYSDTQNSGNIGESYYTSDGGQTFTNVGKDFVFALAAVPEVPPLALLSLGGIAVGAGAAFRRRAGLAGRLSC